MHASFLEQPPRNKAASRSARPRGGPSGLIPPVFMAKGYDQLGDGGKSGSVGFIPRKAKYTKLMKDKKRWGL